MVERPRPQVDELVDRLHSSVDEGARGSREPATSLDGREKS
jgi:hypothetical protein